MRVRRDVFGGRKDGLPRREDPRGRGAEAERSGRRYRHSRLGCRSARWRSDIRLRSRDLRVLEVWTILRQWQEVSSGTGWPQTIRAEGSLPGRQIV